MKKRSAFGWAELIIGALLIFLGISTFINPGQALDGLVILFGIAAVIMGIADFMLYLRMERYLGFGPVVSLVSGVVSVMAGLMLILHPDAGRWILSLLFPIWFIAHCISRLTHLGSIRILAGNTLYCLTLVFNILGLALGLLMLLDPVLSVLSIGAIAGAYLLLLGIDSIILGLSSLGA